MRLEPSVKISKNFYDYGYFSIQLVGLHDILFISIQVRNKWKHETKFVLKRVGQDPSWRARLGNLMSFNEDQEINNSGELQ